MKFDLYKVILPPKQKLLFFVSSPVTNVIEICQKIGLIFFMTNIETQRYNENGHSLINYSWVVKFRGK